jgi:hypothetical protein
MGLPRQSVALLLEPDYWFQAKNLCVGGAKVFSLRGDDGRGGEVDWPLAKKRSAR